MEHQWNEIDIIIITVWSQKRVADIGTKLGMDDRGIVVRYSAAARDFSLLQHLQTGSGARPPSYSPRVKVNI
jgi:hypothetical protein